MNDQSKPPSCNCPYCDGPIHEQADLCQPCGVRISYCSKCGKPLPKNASSCPECNAAIPRERENKQ